ncbi:hypothetical protein [Granulicella sibirica]|uniref:Uncharacterized protein n=1 Tax=Granulicella sibirica TaxID=2479048 RepID=A0A4Q0SWT8_9BACT|nr:hypothetical protein [Granulicella sibirica]RXH55553.1 hypothetical protein GRAN_2410 [Granulicella sibirica]
MPILNLSGTPDVAGNSVTPQGTTSAKHPELNGTVVYDDVIPLAETFDEPIFAESLSIDYPDLSGGLTLFGELQRRVVQSTETGLYSFYYRLTNDSNSVATVFTVVLYPPMSAYVEVDYRLDGLGQASPSSIDSGLPEPYSSFNGQNPEIEFQTAIRPGESSKFFLALPFAKKNFDGSTDFKSSGATGFLKSGGNIALGITTTLLPIGFVFPAPTVVPLQHRTGTRPPLHPGRVR